MKTASLDDAIQCLQEIRDRHPEMNEVKFGQLTLEFKDGKLWSVGPYPHLLRGKDFSAPAQKGD